MLHPAAALIFLTGVAHSYLGERYMLVRLFKRDHLPKLFGGTEFTTGTPRFAWHLTTVAWWGLAYLIVLVAFVSGALPLYFGAGAVAPRPMGAGGFSPESPREGVEGAALPQAARVWRPAQGKR